MPDPTARGAELPAPDISFLMAARNAAPVIGAALRSALDQRRVRVEVVVVDDASTDDTAAVVARLAEADPRVRLVRHEAARGPAAARNAAIRAARGRWLAVLDADDIVLPDRARMLLDLAEATGVDCVADNVVPFTGTFDPAGAPLMPRGREPYLFEVGMAAYLDSNVLLRAGFPLGYLKPMIRAGRVRDLGLRYDEDVRIGEDFLFCLAALAQGVRYLVTSEGAYGYRRSASSLSHRLAEADVARLAAGYDRLEARFGLDADPRTRAASQRYRSGLATARIVTGVVARAQAGQWRAGAGRALLHPPAWPILANQLRQAVRKRLSARRFARPAVTSEAL
ncbi:glycosyltransferase family 2 protein [Methylobacterium sp. A54F]